MGRLRWRRHGRRPTRGASSCAPACPPSWSACRRGRCGASLESSGGRTASAASGAASSLCLLAAAQVLIASRPAHMLMAQRRSRRCHTLWSCFFPWLTNCTLWHPPCMCHLHCGSVPTVPVCRGGERVADLMCPLSGRRRASWMAANLGRREFPSETSQHAIGAVSAKQRWCIGATCVATIQHHLTPHELAHPEPTSDKVFRQKPLPGAILPSAFCGIAAHLQHPSQCLAAAPGPAAAWPCCSWRWRCCKRTEGAWAMRNKC